MQQYEHNVHEPDNFAIWHDKLGHLGSIIMRRIIEYSHEH